MAQKRQQQKPKHIPKRTCIACRETAGKRDFMRLVRSDGNVQIDPTGKQAGRGAYLHNQKACWQLALETRRIEQALRVKLSPDARQHLIAYMESLKV